MPLTLELRQGDSVRIGSSTSIRLEKAGSRPRLSFDSPDEVRLVRKEAEIRAPVLIPHPSGAPRIDGG